MANEKDVVSIDLCESDCFSFLEIWESFPMLWDQRNRDFKNKRAKARALEQFAERFGHGWTTDQVSRKIDSLKSCYRKVKSRKKCTTGAPASQRKQWVLFDRIHSFYGSMNYIGAGVVRSSCPGYSQSQGVLETNEDAEDFDEQASGDMQHQRPLTDELHHEARSWNPSGNSTISFDNSTLQPGTSRCSSADHSNSTDCPRTKQLPTATYGPLSSKIPRLLGNRSATAPPQEDGDFIAAAVGFLQQLQEQRKNPENPHIHFAMVIAENLCKIKSSRRLEILKHKMNVLVHEALMEEMSDSDDNL